MKKITAYTINELSEDIRETLREKETEYVVELKLDILVDSLVKGHITEEEYYKQIGCTKYYAESTSWFVPSVYYENNTKEVQAEAEESLNRGLYTIAGRYIQQA